MIPFPLLPRSSILSTSALLSRFKAGTSLIRSFGLNIHEEVIFEGAPTMVLLLLPLYFHGIVNTIDGPRPLDFEDAIGCPSAFIVGVFV